jgi:tRNA-splicing ligase RtcB
MKLHVLGIDLGKTVFHLVGLDSTGRVVIRKKCSCAPIHSDLGQRYLGAMRAATNCALANRQIITHLVRTAFEQVLTGARLTLLYDVSHNACKIEQHSANGDTRELFVHRKGATRNFGPGHPDLPPQLKPVGQRNALLARNECRNLLNASSKL